MPELLSPTGHSVLVNVLTNDKAWLLGVAAANCGITESKLVLGELDSGLLEVVKAVCLNSWPDSGFEEYATTLVVINNKAPTEILAW